jgi:Fasciclin domain
MIRTSNGGALYKISRLVDPFGTTYGISTPQGIPTTIDKRAAEPDKTMTDLVASELRLSIWQALIKQVLPAILKRLSDRRGPEGGSCVTPQPVVFLPDNSAFNHIPSGYSTFLRAPFNFAFASHVLAWGISVPTCANFTSILSEIRTKGKFEIFSHRADISLTIREAAPNSGELLVNNARVLSANRCAGNGCVWIVDRFLDPVYGLF